MLDTSNLPRGITVIGSCVTNKKERTGMLLVDRGEGHDHRYVVARFRSGESEWMSGRYLGLLSSAIALFADEIMEGIDPMRESA